LALDSLNADEVIGAIRKTVMEEHELQVYGVVLLKTGSIHKTSSGKIQRRACKRGFLDSTLAAVATDVLEDDPTATDEELLGRDELLAVQPEERQAALVASMRSYLAHLLKIGPSRVDVNGPLSELGIDSLSIIELRHRIETDLAVDVPVDLLVEGVSLDQLGAHIVDQVTSGEPA
jgi:acyl carrier protein